jgi:hypothetical protein
VTYPIKFRAFVQVAAGEYLYSPTPLAPTYEGESTRPAPVHAVNVSENDQIHPLANEGSP